MPGSERQNFLQELKRRKVYRVAAAYAAIAFVVIQVADLVLPAFDLSGFTYRLVVITALLGFPVAVVLAWIYELTPTGLRKTRNSTQANAGGQDRGLPAVAEFLLVAIIVVSAVSATWYLATRHVALPESERSIAVLPFTEVGGDSGLPFTDGVHDDLLTRLSNIQGLTVIARNSVQTYRDSDAPLSDIAAELGVRWILEGEVRRIENEVLLNTRLVDPASGVQAWGETFRYSLTAENLFAVQSEIAHRIAELLETRLTPQEERSIGAVPTKNLEAYRLFISASTLLEQREEPQMRQALAQFRKAVELDPGFVLAWVGVANSLYELVDYGFPMPEGTIEEARAAAERALRLDPDNPEALVSMGIIHHLTQDGIRALSHLQRAIELRPGYAEAFSKISWVSQMLGRLDVAKQAADQSIRLNPLAIEPRANFAMTRLMDQNPQAALEALLSESGMIQQWSTLRFYEGVVLHHLDRYQEAADVLRGLDIPWAGQGPFAALALTRAAQGDERGARAAIDRLRERQAHPFLIALVYSALGETENAFREIDSIRSWSIDADWPILAARFLFPRESAALRADPRYDRMLRQIDQEWGLVR